MEVALEIDVRAKVGAHGVASFGGLGCGGALDGCEGGEGAADASALMAPTGAECLAGLVAEDGLARRGVAVGGELREDGFAARYLVLCSTAATGAFDEFGAGRTGIPVASRLAEMAA